jgi:GT2 family glycosyltransferase
MESAKLLNNGKSFSLEELATKAVKKQEAGQQEEAIALYLKVISSNSVQPAWLYSNTITLLVQQERFAEALLYSEQGLIIHSTSEQIYQALDLLYHQSIDLANYINHYQQLMAFEPQQPDWLYYNLAQQLFGNEQIEAAIQVAEQGTQLYSEYYPLHYLLGNALSNLKQWSKAIASYQRVQQLKPDWLEVEAKLHQAKYCNRHAFPKIISPSKSAKIDSNLEPINHVEVQEADLERIFAQMENNQLSFAHCQQIWQNFTGAELTLNYGYWLSPSILYLEAKVNNHWVLNQVTILACSPTKYAIAQANFFQIASEQVAGVACFNHSVDLEDDDRYRLCICDRNTPVFIVGDVAQKAYNLELIDYLNAKSNYQKHLIRESLSSSLIKLIPEPHKPEAAHILQKLQYFLNIPTSNYVDPNLPFKIFIDYIIPLQYDGLFISGWLQDAYEILESITAISALGFALEISNQDIYRLERHDVNQFLQDTRYSNFDEEMGFCAYVSVPEAIQQSINGFAELHSFRFLVKLQGNIQIEIIPDAKYSDFYNARQKVMQIASPERVSAAMLANCIAPAGLKLQQLCMKQVAIKNVTEIGSVVNNPLVSIIIPLYRRLDFMKVQLATMANDPAIKQCQIIYVLDSPEQEEELKTWLLNHCTLYQLAIKLIVMKRNSGYAAANNAGASQATGKYLVLLNSDVFAKTKGWMTKMAEFYAASPKIGVLGAKLLYEDDSLQHAGMFFAQTTFPFWLTLHYYKGLPGNYPLAQQTRVVPAVTGACLMIRKQLYDQVGGLTTDYIIGDFEDSDLCFKCRELGYESWYFADAVLYHLERQSVPLNSSYNGSLAWRLNGLLHQERWGKAIAQVMNCATNN